MGIGRSRAYRPRLDERAIKTFQTRLLRWFRDNGRDLPWRRTRDPYEILVSEVMLQQTQVDRVQGFYQRFLEEYPTAQDLAAAPPARVRDSWEGLGYYARARNLHAAARQIVEEHGGRFPTRLDEVMALPGVGRYTAGAVVSFAYGQPAPILDTNVRRVLSRVFVRRRSSRRAVLDRRLWTLAEAAVPPDRAWEFNQAIMDLGATVCTARNPACPQCPLRKICAYYGKLQRRD
jgi:A/G-specific adenine glycosylase